MRDLSIQRRRFLEVSLAGLGGLPVAELVSAGERTGRRARAKACILLYMDGGPSQLDLWDVKPDAPAEICGPWQPIDTTAAGITIGEHLPLVARQMHRLTLVRSLSHQEMVHDPAVYQMITGHKHISSAGGLEVEETDAPQIGAAFAKADISPAVMPKAIELPETMRMGARTLPGQNGGYLGATSDPFRVELMSDAESGTLVHKADLGLRDELTRQRLMRFGSLVSRLNGELCRQGCAAPDQFAACQRQALEILAAPTVEAAFELEREPPAMRERYGVERHGQSVLLARRLVEAGARFVTVYWGKQMQDWADGKGPQLANNPWDTHRNHFPLVKDQLLPPADRALAALVEDLDERGMLDETLVVWMGDFGRTPRISKPFASRDHWPAAFSIVMAGAGLPRGAVYGRTDRHAAEVIEDRVSPADLTATIFNLLGVDPAAVLTAADGRRYPLSTGRPIVGLV